MRETISPSLPTATDKALLLNYLLDVHKRQHPDTFNSIKLTKRLLQKIRKASIVVADNVLLPNHRTPRKVLYVVWSKKPEIYSELWFNMFTIYDNESICHEDILTDVSNEALCAITTDKIRHPRYE